MPHLHPSRRSAPLENKIYFPNASSEQLIHFNSVTVCVDTQRIKLLSFPADSKPFVSPAFRGILLLEAGVLLRGHGGGGALGFGLLVVLVSPCVAIRGRGSQHGARAQLLTRSHSLCTDPEAVPLCHSLGAQSEGQSDCPCAVASS